MLPLYLPLFLDIPRDYLSQMDGLKKKKEKEAELLSKNLNDVDSSDFSAIVKNLDSDKLEALKNAIFSADAKKKSTTQ